LLGVAAVKLFGVPIMRVLSWIVGGFWGFLVLGILGAGAVFILWSTTDSGDGRYRHSCP